MLKVKSEIAMVMMGIFSALLALVRGLPSQRTVTRNFDVFFDLRQKKQTVEQTMETPVIWDALVLIVTLL